MGNDPIIEEIRAHRAELAGRFNNDLRKICEDIRRREQQSGREFVSFSPRSPGFRAIPSVPSISATPFQAPTGP